MLCKVSFISEMPDVISVSQGERIYVVERVNQDWWFIRKKITNQSGFVPAKTIIDTVSYTHYINESIDKFAEELPTTEYSDELVLVKEVPSFSNVPSETIIAHSNEKLVIEFNIVGKSQPHLIFFKESQIIQSSSRIQFHYSTDRQVSFVFDEVLPFDAGLYSVIAKNDIGFSKVSFNILVEGKIAFENNDYIKGLQPNVQESKNQIPLISKLPEFIEIEKNDSFTVKFSVYSFERPKIKILKDQEYVLELDRFQLTQTSQDEYWYHYELVCTRTIDDDDCLYDLVAQNSEGESSYSIEVIFKHKKEKPSFKKTFTYTKIIEGNQLLLEVSTKGSPRPKISWYFNGDRILTSQTTIIRQQNFDGVLAISNVSKTLHDGTYECRVQNFYGSCSHFERVEVIKRSAKFLERLRDVEVYEADKALMTVKISSEEDDVVWYKDGQKLPITSADYEYIKDKNYRKLSIDKANISHQGEYTCVLGHEECSADLVVIEQSPEITKHLKDVNIIYGENCQFTVELSKGDAILEWFKDSKEITFNERVKLEIDGKQQKLFINNAKLEDAGEYSCALKGQRSRAKLIVQYPSTEFIVRLPEDYTVDEDCEALFEVEISRPDVDVYWYKNGEEVRESSNVKFIKENTIRRLIIRRTKMHDCGEYICLAKGDQTKTELTVSKESLVFNLKLKDFNVNEGETATLSTEVIDETFNVTWIKDGHPIEPDDRIIISESGKYRKFIIKNVCPQDKGVYTVLCEGQRSSSKISVLSPPKVTSDCRKYTAIRNKNFLLEVPFEGYPAPRVEWYYSGRILKTSKKMSVEILMSRTVLTIKNFDNDDIGTYKLCLENAIGQYMTHFEVFIIDRPEPPDELSIFNITNNSLILCWDEPTKDNGSPITHYIVEFKETKSNTWKEYNEFINEEHAKITNLKHNFSYIFRIYSVNRAGRSDPSPESVPVIVQEQDSFNAPKVIQNLPPKICTFPFRTVVLECKITGNPTPTIQWKREDVLLGESDDNYIFKYDKETVSLVIKECLFNMAGDYECIANNEHGEESTTTNLVIEEKPYSKFDPKLSLVKVKQNSSHSIYCEIYGYPYPEIFWYKGGSSIEDRDYTVVKNESNLSILTIENITIEDSGIYTLHLVNSAGECKYDFEVKMLNRPGPPDYPVRCTNCNDDSIELSWNPPKDDGGSPILYYLIEKCETRFSEWHEVIQVTANNFTHKIYDLTPNSKYRFRIRSINEYGVSDPLVSDPIICKSPYDKPEPPTGPLKTSDHTQDSFVLYWNPPEHDGNTPILEYIIEMKEENKKIWNKVGSVDGETLSMKIEELITEKSYNFRISCRNKIGLSEPYTSEEAITVKCRFGPPTIPIGPLCVSEMTNTSLTLSWNPPASNGGLCLTSYIIERKLTFENNWIRETMLEPDILNYTVNNLFAKYEYNFRVFAENALGQSPPLESEMPIQLCQNASPPGIPSAPLEIRAVSPSAIIIEWGKPEHDGGAPITGYVIAARDAKRTMWMEVGKVGADIHKLQIKDLQEGRSYQVRVLAQNEIGLSDPLEAEEPIKVVRPPGFNESELEDEIGRDDTLSLSFTTSETTSWMREANVEPNVESYTRHSLLRRREYFFKVWFYADKLFK